MRSLLLELKQANWISAIDYQFAKLIDEKQQPYHYPPEVQNLALLLAALVSSQVMQGHSALRLSSTAALYPFGLAFKRDEHAERLNAELQQKIGDFSPPQWQTVLQNHIAFSTSPEQVAPMLFQDDRLYFYRYWQSEHRIAAYLTKAVKNRENVADPERVKQILADLFPTKSADTDWQAVAVATALKQPFTLISGGPGTGKTYTVVRLLAALQLMQLKQAKPLFNIALAAPTGKAASRMKEAIRDDLNSLALPASLKAQLQLEASTLHSLIGIHPLSDKPKYHAQHPLHFDVVVVDEASMIDLFLMEKLVNALKPNTRLILLGDKDQLASVEAGSVLGELGQFIRQGYSQRHCDYLNLVTHSELYASQPQLPAICDSLCFLRKSQRFGEDTGIGKLARLTNSKQTDKSWQLLQDPPADLQLHLYPERDDTADSRAWLAQCVRQIVRQAVNEYRDYLNLVKQRAAQPDSVSVEAIFAAFQKVRFLSALRVSPLGVEQLNQSIAEALQEAQLVAFRHSRESYLGKPILITENAPSLHIFSGDIGIMLPDEKGNLRVYFETENEGKRLNLSPVRLPNYEVAYVMTVHKSQGSQFAHTILVLPASPSPVLTKELVYTAITRSRERFSLFGEEKMWKFALKNEISRQSGLSQQLLVLEAVKNGGKVAERGENVATV